MGYLRLLWSLAASLIVSTLNPSNTSLRRRIIEQALSAQSVSALLLAYLYRFSAIATLTSRPLKSHCNKANGGKCHIGNVALGDGLQSYRNSLSWR
jgi:hypothetical protein